MEQPGSAAVSKRRRGTQLDVTTTVLVQKGKNTKQRQIVNCFFVKIKKPNNSIIEAWIDNGKEAKSREKH